MKKTSEGNKIYFWLCAIIMLFSCAAVFQFFRYSIANIKSVAYSYESSFYSFEYKSRTYRFSENEIKKELKLTKLQEDNNKRTDKPKLVQKLQSMGFEIEEAVRYVYPESEIILKKLQKIIEKKSKPEQVRVVENSCKLKFVPASHGVYINKQKFYENYFLCAKQDKKNISFSIDVGTTDDGQRLSNLFVEKGCFSTNFSTSNESRKNNIRVALSAFDGIMLDEGEVLSFNRTTGVRNESSGYMPAKIITGGTYTLGFGGGVCQVSTTLYNACLLAGLEILEVNSHSLPVSYVEPSFDAMVNVGSSDLVVRNNTNGKIIITTSSQGDVCKVKIFGLKNQYKITRTSEKTKIIPAKDDIVDTDYQKYGIEDLEVGEERRMSYKKDGYYSNGYLNFYDSAGNLIETKKIRSNKYNATTGVVVKREE